MIDFLISRVRFHYGHPDVFDRLFHLTRGGVSKASKIINLSEDIFAGMFFCPCNVLLLVNFPLSVHAHCFLAYCNRRI